MKSQSFVLLKDGWTPKFFRHLHMQHILIKATVSNFPPAAIDTAFAQDPSAWWQRPDWHLICLSKHANMTNTPYKYHARNEATQQQSRSSCLQTHIETCAKSKQYEKISLDIEMKTCHSVRTISSIPMSMSHHLSKAMTMPKVICGCSIPLSPGKTPSWSSYSRGFPNKSPPFVFAVLCGGVGIFLLKF